MAATKKPTALLLQAINDADKTTLQSVLKSMCEASDEFCEEASKRLLVTRVHKLVDLEDEESNEEPEPARKKQKRDVFITEMPVSRYATCSACHKRFDTTENREDSCQLHDGLSHDFAHRY
jgi:hypothetical protein